MLYLTLQTGFSKKEFRNFSYTRYNKSFTHSITIYHTKMHIFNVTHTLYNTSSVVAAQVITRSHFATIVLVQFSGLSRPAIAYIQRRVRESERRAQCAFIYTRVQRRAPVICVVYSVYIWGGEKWDLKGEKPAGGLYSAVACYTDPIFSISLFYSMFMHAIVYIYTTHENQIVDEMSSFLFEKGRKKLVCV